VAEGKEKEGEEVTDIAFWIIGFFVGSVAMGVVMGTWAGRTIKRLRSGYDEALEQGFKRRMELFDENQLLRRKLNLMIYAEWSFAARDRKEVKK
jgi:hypothetical protein